VKSDPEPPYPIAYHEWNKQITSGGSGNNGGGDRYRGGRDNGDRDHRKTAIAMTSIPNPPQSDPTSMVQQRAMTSRNTQSSSYATLLRQRNTLPVTLRRGDVLQAANGSTSRVSVVAGETGSGKTTQVPQFLLDELLADPSNRGGRIVVTQPRRLAATSVAQRVAQERGEQLGQSIGYQVRLDAVHPTWPCSVMFCTTGILLRQLSGAGGLDGVVHIIVDEVSAPAKPTNPTGPPDPPDPTNPTDPTDATKLTNPTYRCTSAISTRTSC
jgi:HrpA-like RNA helicase